MSNRHCLYKLPKNTPEKTFSLLASCDKGNRS